MTTTNKVIAFLSYLLLVPGWLFVLIFRRKQTAELMHARQSMLINLVPILFYLVWLLFTWLVIAIPIMGPLVAWFAFAMLIAVSIVLVVLWVAGMLKSLRGDQKPLALIGTWAAKLPF